MTDDYKWLFPRPRPPMRGWLRYYLTHPNVWRSHFDITFIGIWSATHAMQQQWWMPARVGPLRWWTRYGQRRPPIGLPDDWRPFE